MHHFEAIRAVDHSAARMFDLVADIESYPDFVPLCASTLIESRTVENGKEVIISKMTVAYSLLRETFTSRVVLDRDEMAIDVTGIAGPFSKMDNTWRFEAAGEESCKVAFSIDYEFRSRTLGLLIGGLFDTAFRRFAAAFEARADKLYSA